MKKVILNQKSYLFYDEMVKFKNDFDKLKPNNYEFVLFPPILYLSMFKDSKYNNNDYIIGIRIYNLK